ncbi:MAG TPA: response regulator [Candidatus Udaeobacter sp.]|jgi:DNA-binding NtrC family response regulator|nr:response regulator [Candidatus Udaeobacter sp.]
MEILIIDDDEIFCRLLVEIIEDWGAMTNWTTDGLAAYEMMSKHTYHLCIIDVCMPLILGTELADAMREDFPDVKVILISAFADDSLRDDAARKGIFFLSKPFTPDRLLRTIELAIGEPTC